MNWRYERKFILKDYEYSKFSFFLKKNYFKKQYEDRIVNTVYLDSIDFDNFTQNIEGNSRRIKYRVRWYNELKNSEVFLEKKNKYNNLNYKEIFSLGYFKSEYEIFNYLNKMQFPKSFFIPNSLKAVLKIQYQREYWKNEFNIRSTLDYDVKVFPWKSINELEHSPFLFNRSILEVKYSSTEDNFIRKNFFNKYFNFILSKSSKYTQGVRILNINGYC
jgi:SPX domain protein involved in polyphosphate accumulation